MIAYTVTCTFDDPAVADEWIAWLRAEHLRDVCAAGATGAKVIRHDGEPCRCEVRYLFESREAFTEYETRHAPGLREEGLKRFPLERGLTYERVVGQVVGEFEGR